MTACHRPIRALDEVQPSEPFEPGGRFARLSRVMNCRAQPLQFSSTTCLGIRMAHRNMTARDMSLEESEVLPFPAHPGNRRTICVFCGSSPGAKPVYAQAAREFGQLLGENGYRLVFGGGGIGLMGEVARAARDAGAPVIGILPAFLRSLEPPLKSAEELVITPDLQQRKARMLALADAFILLPGGLGTMDEFFEVLTTAQLLVHHKPILVIDVKGYFQPLKALLDHIVAHGFAREQIAALHEFVASPEEAMRLINSRRALA